MTLHQSIVIVPDTPSLSLSDVVPVAAAINTQIVRDVAPLWGLHASVSACKDRGSIPAGAWPVFVGAEGQGGGGVHEDKDKQPFALVDLSSEWTIAASHEIIEMLGDPAGVRLHTAHSIDPAYSGRVQYLVELCDPPESLSYEIDGIAVSDFLTPSFYNSHARAGIHYDFMAQIAAPLNVLRGGYISFVRPDTHEWFQLTNFGRPVIKSLGHFDASFPSLRAWVDSRKDRP